MRSWTHCVLPSLAVLEDLDLRLPDLRLHVAFVAVVGLDQIGVGLELRFLVGAAAGDPAPERVRGLVVLHLAAQRAVALGDVAEELDVANLDLGAFSHVERDVDQLGPAGDRRHGVRHQGVGEALLRHHLAQHGLDAADRPLSRNESSRSSMLRARSCSSTLARSPIGLMPS